MHPSIDTQALTAGNAAAILESITDAFFSLDEAWRFTYLNRQAEIVLGQTTDQLYGKGLFEVYPGLVGSELEAMYRRAVSERVASAITSYYPDHQRWYEAHAYPGERGLSVYFRNVSERIAAEERVRESELRFRLMADSIPQMVWIVDADREGMFFNKQWTTYTGALPETRGPADIARDFLHPDDLAGTMQAWDAAVAEGRIFSSEHRLRSASGAYRWFLARAEPYRDPPSGAVVRWFGTSTDVHDRKLAEASLRKSEERYRSLFESIDEGFCIIEVIFDQQGNPADYRFCEVNPMFEKLSGLQGAVGKTMRELVPGHEDRWFQTYGKVAMTGQPIRFENEARALGRWFDVYAFRIDEPAARRVALLFKDITERQSAEAELRRSELQALEAARLADERRRRLDAVLEAVPVGIVVVDEQGEFLHANAASKRLWGAGGYQTDDGRELAERKAWWADGSARHGRPLQPREWVMARALGGEDAPRDVIEIESFDPVPVRRTVLASGAPIRDAAGKIIGAVVAQMDITDRVRAEEALKQADRRKDEFLAMLAHELRNPLAPIGAAATLLAMGRLDDARVRQTSDIITRQVRHMTGLVDDLLDVSRVTGGLVTLQQARLDAKRVLADAVEQVRPLIEARRHRLTVRTPPESAFIVGDQKRLVQVMTNVLNNAAKYTPEGGDIVLDMAVEGEHVKMTVSDNGIGMAPDLVARAFELFAQAERTSDRSQGGLGIGLALVKTLVELHGGSATAESAGIGKGSRFTVCLPHVAEQGAGAGAERRAVIEAAPGAALKVLIVDDNVDAAEMLALFIDAVGHRVTVEHAPLQALARARAEVPDVCLLDIGLPDIDGYELARRMRGQPETAGAVLVAVTGYGQEQDRATAFEAGFDHHFVKPVEPAALARLLGELGSRPSNISQPGSEHS